MFTLKDAEYPLTRMEASEAYPARSAFCDGCHVRIQYTAMCYHSSKQFDTQRGGFDLCESCYDNVKFCDPNKKKSRPTTGTRVKLVGLVRRQDLNETFGQVANHPSDERRVGVRLDGETVPVSVSVDNLLVQPHFVMVENDTLRIFAPTNSMVKVDGENETRRVIPVEDLRASKTHRVEINGFEHTISMESCAICMSASDSLHPFVGHPVYVCDACIKALSGRPCPFCRSTTGDHTSAPTKIDMTHLPLASHDVRLYVKVASLKKRYELVVTPTQIEIRAKYMKFTEVLDLGTTRGGPPPSLSNASAAMLNGNGSTVTVRPPADFVIDVHNSYTEKLTFDDLVSNVSILYRLSEDDDVRKSSDFVDGRTALKRARFDLSEERVALVICVVNSSGWKRYVHIFFSVNFRLPGIVALMPDPDGEVAQQCVSIIDFYDPKMWCSTHPAVNHNNLVAFRSAYGNC